MVLSIIALSANALRRKALSSTAMSIRQISMALSMTPSSNLGH